MKVRLFATLAVLLSLLLSVHSRAADMEGPYVYKSSVHISARHYLVYYPTPTAKEPQYLTGSWAPRFDFNVQGPLEGGSQISVAFTKPDGSKWFSSNLRTEEIAADAFQHFSFDGNEGEKLAITQTGIASLAVNLSNALTKTNKTLYTAKFEVGKFHYGSAPNEKNQADYYVVHDWALPIGQISWDTKDKEEAPQMRIALWFRGPISSDLIAGYMYYKGKQIASSKDAGGAYEMTNIEPGMTRPDLRWSRWNFIFARVSSGRVGNSANNYDSTWFLDKNPGEYEVKFLRDGKLARSCKFTIGDDGKLVDNGLGTKNKMGNGVILLPVECDLSQDGKANIANYKTQAFYGNPLVGFP